MKIIYLTFFLLLAIPMTSYSQSIFLNQGENAGTVGIGIGNIEEETFFSLHGVYSLKGKTDFTLGYERNNLGDEFTLNNIILGVEHLLIKQKSGTPFNLHVGGNYILGSFTGETIDDFGVDLSSSAYEFFGGISHAFNKIIPYVTAKYNNTTLKASSGGVSESESDSMISFTVGSHIGFNIGTKILAFNPYYSFGDLSIFGLKLSLVLK